ncbi:MAG: hypothetical protein U0798_20785 [Gemmataceae bacterium]
MAHRMSTAQRMDRLRDNSAISRATNGALKRKASVSREKRMKALLKKGTYPYTPAIMSWVCVQLNKKVSQVTAEECKKLAG